MTACVGVIRSCPPGHDRLDAYAHFDNDWHGHAVTNATWLRDRLDEGAS